MAKTHSSFTPSLSDPETLEALFVAREGLARSIVDAIRDSATTGNKHQRLLLGPRGIGKTHLVALIHHRVRADRTLAALLRIAWLPEDPYIAGYGTLLTQILRQLRQDEVGLEWLAERLDTVLDQDDAARQEAMLERLLLDILDDRTLLLIIENLDDLLLALREEGQRKLRAFVQNHGRVAILATSTSLIEALTEREKTFYGFFRTQTLTPFGVEEAADLLARLAKHAGDAELADLIWSPLGLARVRAVHYLAGGNPRIYVIFHDFLTRESLDDLVTPFMRLMDELTPYYQARISRLAPLQRGIIEALRRLRAAAPVKAIAREVLATSQTVSAQLGKLVDLGYVIQADSLGRSNYYELREPLMRLCLEVKEQRSQTVTLFVQFLRIWYSRSDLENLAGREFLRKAIDLAGEPKTAADWSRRGNDLWLMNRPDEALQAYRKALEIEPHRIEAWDDFLGLLKGQGRYRLFHRLAERAASLMPEQARLQSYLGTASRDLGDFNAALACYERALAADPELDQKGEPATLLQAQVLGDMGQYGEVLRRLEQPQPGYSKNLEFRCVLTQADALMWLDRWDEGISALDRLLAQTRPPVWTGADLGVVSGLILRSHNPQIWRRFIPIWLDLFQRHGVLAELGEALVRSIRRFAIDWITDQTAAAWLATWRDLAGEIAELALPLRLLAAGVAYKAHHDPRALLDLAREERGLLEPWLVNLFKETPDTIDRELEGLLQTIERQLAKERSATGACIKPTSSRTSDPARSI
ncbi:MAG: tetratricopeptide repeat protein [Candidatus Competibacteraceae bacterium]|nr:tetratricopeptide repeat protein [Candidatus Competibacteraceae bacterium]